jgi:hypothetical protein
MLKEEYNMVHKHYDPVSRVSALKPIYRAKTISA